MPLTSKHVLCFGSAKVLIIFEKLIQKYQEAPVGARAGGAFLL